MGGGAERRYPFFLIHHEAHEGHGIVGAQLIAPVRLAVDESPVDSNLGAMNRAATGRRDTSTSVIAVKIASQVYCDCKAMGIAGATHPTRLHPHQSSIPVVENRAFSVHFHRRVLRR